MTYIQNYFPSVFTFVVYSESSTFSSYFSQVSHIRRDRQRFNCWRLPYLRITQQRRGRVLGNKQFGSVGYWKNGEYVSTHCRGCAGRFINFVPAATQTQLTCITMQLCLQMQ
jgi:hypothetical protein